MRKTVVASFMTAGAVRLWASFGPLSPPAAPCEREYIWPEGKMPDVQAHQVAAKTAEKKALGFMNDQGVKRP